MSITDILKEHFIQIVSKHNNPTWARQELEWLVYCQYKHEYNKLNEKQQLEVDLFFSALRKVQFE
jgi:hypothetical protein